MRRRELITLLGGAAAVWPLAARAQRPDRIRRIGVLMPYPDTDLEARAAVKVFREELHRLGWTGTGSVQIDERWSGIELDRMRADAKELVDAKPDVILVRSPSALRELRQITNTVPIVFAAVSDPVRAGFVATLARPGGNITGFSLIEFPVIGKLLDMLKQIAPHVARVALVSNPDNPSNALYASALEAAARSFTLQTTIAHVRDAAEIEKAIESFARGPNGGLLVPPDVLITIHRDLFVDLAARHRLPAIYSDRAMVASGGLISYGVDRIELFRQAASYVDRILRGEKPGDLPVQQPIKFEMAINMKAAKALGLDVPVHLQQLAEEVIE
jgi:putative ABC transport system substrate-binding protein